MVNFFDGFNENFGVPPKCNGTLKCDDEFIAGEGRVAIDYKGDLIGMDVFPFIDGVEMSGQPAQMESLSPAVNGFLEVPRTDVELDTRHGDDVWVCESCPMLERPLAELSLFGPEHALKILDLGCDQACIGVQQSQEDQFEAGMSSPLMAMMANQEQDSVTESDNDDQADLVDSGDVELSAPKVPHGFIFNDLPIP